MIEKICDILRYLVVVKATTLISKVIVEPRMEELGYSEKQIERFVLLSEFIQVFFLLILLKKYI